MNQFRVYNKVLDDFTDESQFFLSGDGEKVLKSEFQGGEQRYFDFTTRCVVSFRTPKTDRKGNRVYEGDILKRVRDRVAEFDRKHYKQKGYEVDESMINDRSGSIGIVVFDGMGFSVKLLRGRKRAFHGPEGAMTFDWDEEVEVIGNRWKDDVQSLNDQNITVPDVYTERH